MSEEKIMGFVKYVFIHLVKNQCYKNLACNTKTEITRLKPKLWSTLTSTESSKINTETESTRTRP